MRQYLIPSFAIVIFLVFWETLVWVNDWPNYKMASPSDLWPAFWRFKVVLSYGWMRSGGRCAFVIAIIVGVFLGMIMGFRRSCVRVVSATSWF